MDFYGSTSRRKLRIIMIAALIFVSSARFVFAQQVFRISGASTIQPILESIRLLFEEQTGRTVDLQGGGSGVGLRDAISGESDVGMVSRALSPAEKEQIAHATIGMDALVVIVNTRNPLNETTKQDIIRIFTGEVTNWKELGGADQPIVLISKEVGRSTLDLFEGYSGLQSPMRQAGTAANNIATTAFEIGSNLEGITLVGGIPGAIGYVSYGTAATLMEIKMPVKILRLDGVDATIKTINDGTYPILRELNLVYKEGNDAALSFIETSLSSQGQQAVSNEGFIPQR